MRPPRVPCAIYRCKQRGDALRLAALFCEGRQGEASHQSTVYSRQQAVDYRLTVPGQSKQLLAVRPPRIPCACAVALRAVNRGKQRGDLVGYAVLFCKGRQGEASHQPMVYSRQQATVY